MLSNIRVIALAVMRTMPSKLEVLLKTVDALR